MKDWSKINVKNEIENNKSKIKNEKYSQLEKAIQKIDKIIEESISKGENLVELRNVGAELKYDLSRYYKQFGFSCHYGSTSEDMNIKLC